MILTGSEIQRAWQRGDITISDFSPTFLEPNSYGFHLGEELLIYDDGIVDSYAQREVERIVIPDTGFRLEPDRFYLGHTAEQLGSRCYAAELFARFSTAACGVFIQTSAPLGHTGAIINWTLEIVVAQPVIVYPRMLIGKICFWTNQGDIDPYISRYVHSTHAVPSLLSWSEQ